MKSDIQSLIRDYHDWFMGKTEVAYVADYAVVNIPFIDRHNDYMKVYIKSVSEGVLLTDAGRTISDLYLGGYKFPLDLVNSTLGKFGAKLIDHEIQIKSDTNSFAVNQQNLIQAILAINDLPYLHKTRNRREYINKEVAMWMDSINVEYRPKQKLKGKSGITHNFDFLIPHTDGLPDRLLKVVNKPDKQAAIKLVFNWIDVKETFNRDSSMYAMLNDTGSDLDHDVLKALEEYEVKPVPWSRKESLSDLLVA